MMANDSSRYVSNSMRICFVGVSFSTREIYVDFKGGKKQIIVYTDTERV